jgi:A/G-specific adenine glycosylase
VSKPRVVSEWSLPEKLDLRDFRERLLVWWEASGREFPWRKTRDPYRILMAEVLLHRTRAEQVVPVYEHLIDKFPSIGFLAGASPQEVMQEMRGAGLYWRAKLAHEMATEIVRRFGGAVPEDKQQLQSLPGVSQYIASAVRCFAFGCSEPLLDTNTVRIAGRLFDLPVTDSSRRSKLFRDILDTLLDRERPREFNLALIDLGALVCKSRKPECHLCPVFRHCSYGRKTALVQEEPG